MTALKISRDEQIKEIIKCGKDPVYFINTYAKIQHPKRGTIPFETYPFQDDCIKAFIQHRLNIVLKSRQLGLSTVTAAYALWLAIFHKDKNILVIATKLSTAINFIKKIKVMWASLPEWLRITQLCGETKQEIKFTCGSEIKAIPTSDDAGRSEALSLLVIDEAAFIKNFDELWTGLAPTIQIGGNCIIISTPNGVGGQYYNIWTEAIAGLNNFNPIELPWQIHPEHDEDWFKEQEKILGYSQKKIAQELLCQFNGSGDTFLQSEEVSWLQHMKKPPIRKDNMLSDIWIWKEPVQGHTYVVSADISRGDSKDFSAFHVIDTVECEVVVEYKGKIPPDRLADHLIRYGTLYNKALIVPEKNSFGYATAAKLKAEEYSKLYYERARYDYSVIKDDSLPGFNTDKTTRPLILGKLEELIRNRVLTIYSERFIHEITTFVWVGSRAQAIRGCNDDIVMSLAIGTWIIDNMIGFTKNSGAIVKSMLACASKISRNVDALPGMNTVKPVYNPKIMSTNMTRPQPADVYNNKFGGMIDYSWLLK